MSGGVRGRKFLNQRNFLLLDLSPWKTGILTMKRRTIFHDKEVKEMVKELEQKEVLYQANRADTGELVQGIIFPDPICLEG